MRRLRIENLVVGLIHAVQGVAILLLANDFSLPVRASFLGAEPGAPDAIRDVELFSLPYAPVIAVFLFLAAADHLLMAAPGVHRWYEQNLQNRINPARWYEYSISASIMIVLIAMLPGIDNAYALIAIFGVNAMMILFGLRMEQVNRDPDDIDWRPYWFGWIAGAVPWIAIAVALATSETQAGSDSEGPPPFVYGIFISLFILFFSFAVNMWLQYRRVGPWRDYLFGERAYIVLSLAAKSALAWQIFGGTLSA